MPTRQVESTHEAEQDHPIQDPNAAGVESPSADQMQGANGLPRKLSDGGSPTRTRTTPPTAIRTSTRRAPKQTSRARPRNLVPRAHAVSAERLSLMADQDPNQDRQDRNVEVPGDTNSADIVGRTGEQMPKQSHDGLEDQRDARTSARE